jgi:hypothetical protein
MARQVTAYRHGHRSCSPGRVSGFADKEGRGGVRATSGRPPIGDPEASAGRVLPGLNGKFMEAGGRAGNVRRRRRRRPAERNEMGELGCGRLDARRW